MLTTVNIYFKLLLPIFMLLILARETLVYMATPSEHYLDDVSFFIPSQIKLEPKKAALAETLSPYISNRKLVHENYKACAKDLTTFKVFYKNKLADQYVKCIDILEKILTNAPSSPLIWMEKAKLHSFQKSQNKLMNQALYNSWKVAKRQAWVANRRVVFALNNWENINSQNQQNAENDFLFFSPNRGKMVKSVALNFLLNPDAKHIVTAWIGKAEAKVQRQFVGHVRSGK